MNKEQAMEAMEAGHKVTHTNFTPEEWIRLFRRGIYEFEDGVHFGANAFWISRDGLSWDAGWRIWKEVS
jgi:hypothetical protein